MNKKIIKLLPIFIFGIITVFSLSACSQKAKEQSTQDMLMSKTWDVMNKNKEIIRQETFTKNKIKCTKNEQEPIIYEYNLTRNNNKEEIKIQPEKNDNEEPIVFEISKHKDEIRFSPIGKNEEDTKRLEHTLIPHQ